MEVYNIELLNEVGELEEVKLEVAQEIKEMIFKDWVGFHLLVDDWPDWLKDFSALSATNQRLASSKWKNEEKATYWLELAKIVNNFSRGGGLEAVLELEVFKNEATRDVGLEILAGNIFEALKAYKPKAIERFTHKGATYVLPKTEVLKIGKIKQTLYMANAKTGEIIEALQREHLYAGKDKNGQLILKDARYHTDLALVACVSRKEIDGELEKIPLSMKGFSDFINKRMEELEDLPATVALDAAFFLLDLNINSLKQATLVSPFKSQRRKRKKRLARRKRRGKKR